MTSKVSFVILTWNSVENIASCLASLPASLTCSFEVIVVDNGSQDGTVDTIKKHFPTVRIIQNSTNSGVACARNQGIRASRGQYVLILDDDTVVHPLAVQTLVQLLDGSARVGLCGPRLVDAEGQLSLSCRLFPTFWDKLSRWLPGNFWRAMRRRTELADWDHEAPRSVDYLIGACQLIRRRALDEVGLLDELIFYGPEDVDLCLRMHEFGWGVMYEPRATVVHDERRIARSMLSGLGWRHMYGVAYYFWKHGYLFSRRGIYARLPGRSLAENKQ